MTKTTAAKKSPARKSTPKTLTAEQKKAVQSVVKKAPFLREGEKESYLDALKRGIYVKAPAVSDYAIEAYTPRGFSPCQPDEGLYDIKKNKFLAFEPGEPTISDILDTVTYACEQGKLNTRTWVTEVFRTRECFEWFLEEFAAYDDCYRIYDRWWYALALLCEHENTEEGFVSTDDIAQRILDWAEETGQTF
jgi:hypothetical protein